MSERCAPKKKIFASFMTQKLWRFGGLAHIQYTIITLFLPLQKYFCKHFTYIVRNFTIRHVYRSKFHSKIIKDYSLENSQNFIKEKPSIQRRSPFSSYIHAPFKNKSKLPPIALLRTNRILLFSPSRTLNGQYSTPPFPLSLFRICIEISLLAVL